jgi:hypothetical protein
MAMIDWTKPLQMRDGTPVVFRFRIDNPRMPRVCTYRGIGGGMEYCMLYTEDGTMWEDERSSILDLKNVEEERDAG